jgi:hypothetical protein
VEHHAGRLIFFGPVKRIHLYYARPAKKAEARRQTEFEAYSHEQHDM